MRLQVPPGYGGTLVAMPTAIPENHLTAGWEAGLAGPRAPARTIKVFDKINGLFIESNQQFFSHLRQACFGIPHGCGKVAINGTEIT